MKPFIIEQDRKAIESDLHPYERRCWLLSLFIERMDQIGYPLNTAQQVASVLASGAEPYVRSQIVDSNHFELAGVRLNRAALLDVIETPDLSEVQSVEKMLKGYHYIPLASLDFKDGKFSVPDAIKQKIIDKHTRYAMNQKHIDMHTAALKVAKAANAFGKEYGPEKGTPLRIHPFSSPDGYLKWNPQKWEWEVDTIAIARQF